MHLNTAQKRPQNIPSFIRLLGNLLFSPPPPDPPPCRSSPMGCRAAFLALSSDKALFPSSVSPERHALALSSRRQPFLTPHIIVLQIFYFVFLYEVQGPLPSPFTFFVSVPIDADPVLFAAQRSLGVALPALSVQGEKPPRIVPTCRLGRRPPLIKC